MLFELCEYASVMRLADTWLTRRDILRYDTLHSMLKDDPSCETWAPAEQHCLTYQEYDRLRKAKPYKPLVVPWSVVLAYRVTSAEYTAHVGIHIAYSAKSGAGGLEIYVPRCREHLWVSGTELESYHRNRRHLWDWFNGAGRGSVREAEDHNLRNIAPLVDFYITRAIQQAKTKKPMTFRARLARDKASLMNEKFLRNYTVSDVEDASEIYRKVSDEADTDIIRRYPKDADFADISSGLEKMVGEYDDFEEAFRKALGSSDVLVLTNWWLKEFRDRVFDYLPRYGRY